MSNRNLEVQMWGSILVLTLACGHSEEGSSRFDTNGTADTGDPLVPGVARTELGEIQGTRDDEGWAFLGIPYALPPTGDRRFRPPEPPEPFDRTFQADAFGPACVQYAWSDQLSGDEDCLTLNVWTPTEITEPLPVQVWIHGGDNLLGSSSEPYYDAAWLVGHEPIVFVTLNYRLGPFGFLQHEALETDGFIGNWGLQDQIAALQWVQDHIAAFGGDPTRVLVHGQSAGADDTCALAASPLAVGLMTRALMQSGGCNALSAETTEATAASTIAAVGCDLAADVGACLRATSTAEMGNVPGANVLNLVSGVDFYVTVDGKVLAAEPLEVFESSDLPGIPFTAGTTTDEYRNLMGLLLEEPVQTEAEYLQVLDAWFGKSAAAWVLSVYPFDDYGDASWALANIVGDYNMHCPTRRALRAVAANGAPTYRYVFSSAFGSGHGDDIPYRFHYFPEGATAAQRALASDVIGYWNRFADVGDPGGESDGAWSLYDPDIDSFLLLSETIEGGAGFRADACDAWDSVL